MFCPNCGYDRDITNLIFPLHCYTFRCHICGHVFTYKEHSELAKIIDEITIRNKNRYGGRIMEDSCTTATN